MKWRDLNLGKKFFVSFGLIIILLVTVAFWAITGIGGIVDSAEELIDGISSMKLITFNNNFNLKTKATKKLLLFANLDKI